MIHITKRWRTPLAVKLLFLFELLGITASLGFFGYASPDAFRTALWQDGGTNGFNSNPADRIYYYANHKTPPDIPFVWSQLLTDYNVAVSVASAFVLLVKVVMFIFDLFIPLVSLFVNICLCAVWAISVYGQAGPDRSEPPNVSSSPWYITKSCSVSTTPRIEHFCNLAKGSFAVTVILMATYAIMVGLSIYSLFSSRNSKHSRNSSFDSEDAITKGSPDSEETADARWEAENPPRNPAMIHAVSPRTAAFNTLSRPMPLRGMQNV